MDNYTRHEKVTKTVSYGLPTGTPYAEFVKLYNIARRELEGSKQKGAPVYDNEIRLVSADDEVLLVFNVEVKEDA